MFPVARPRLAGAFGAWTASGSPVAAPNRIKPQLRLKTWPRLPRRGWGTLLLLALFAAVGAYGSVSGGEYAAFVAENGTPGDVLAKALGFSIETVSIAGVRELTPLEILGGGGISPRVSLALLDPMSLREKLRAIPLIKDATVRKLFPDTLAITVVEREPVALWQKDGQVSLIAGDGVPIDAIHDDRFNALPFVVGDGANMHLPEYLSLLAAAGDLRDKIKAGMLVGERRWTLQMASGVEVELPETGAAEALKRLVDIERQAKVLEKAVISLDLRIPGRITARLTEDAADQRAAGLAKRPKSKANDA